MATTNTVAGVNLAHIAQLSLDALQAEAIPLSAFSTDFSSVIQSSGDTVTTRFPTLPTVQDMLSSRAVGNSAMTARTVTLNTNPGVVIGFTDLQRTFSDINLFELYIQPSINAVVDSVINSALTLVTNANYAQKSTVTAANFDADTVATLAQLLSTAKVPRANRKLILKPTYFASLVKDNAIQNAAAAGGNGALTEHSFPRISGFDVIEYNGTIPSNSESLEGLALAPQGILIAARGVATPPPGTWAGEVQNIADPKSGLPIQIRRWYDQDAGELKMSFDVLFGVQLGVTGNLYRIVSA